METFFALGDEKSSEYITNTGVPQGAVLAPLLFLIYINDMFKSCPKLELIHYADDPTAFVRCNNLRGLEELVNDELNSVNIWLQCNRLTLNIEKSSYMVFSHNETFLNVKINNIIFQRVQKTKFLGIVFDHNLSFRFHCEEDVEDHSKHSS